MSNLYTGDAPVRPIFIIGSYRSGTSVLTWCLGQHSNIWSIPESYWLSRMCADMEYLYRTATHYPRAHLTVTGVSKDLFLSYWRRALHGFVMMAQQQWMKKILYLAKTSKDKDFFINHMISRPDAPKTRWVDGTPENSHYVTPLLTVFPDARFIHLVRDPNKVAASLLGFNRIGSAQYSCTVASAFETWYRLESDAYQAEKAYGSNVVRRFFFDDIVNAPEEELRRVFDFIEDSYEPTCINPLQTPINSSRKANPEEYDRDMENVLNCEEKAAQNCRTFFNELRAGQQFEPNETEREIFLQRAENYFSQRKAIH